MIRILVFVATLFSSSITLAEQVSRYDGEAFAPGSGQLLYRETHYLRHVDSGLNERLVLYRCPRDNGIFARKRIDYRDNAKRPWFELQDARIGYQEGLRADDAGALTFVQRAEAEATQSRGFDAAQTFIADAGFDEFMHQHWDALVAGDAVRFEFLVPSRLRTYAFKIRRHRQGNVAGRDAMVIRLSLGAWWGFIAPHIDAAYDLETRRLLRYEGLSNLRDDEGSNLDVRVEFSPRAPRRVATTAWQRAQSLTLTRTCSG